MRVWTQLRGGNKNGRDLNSSADMRCPYCHGTRLKLEGVYGTVSAWTCKDAGKYPEKHAHARIVYKKERCHWYYDRGNINDTRLGGHNIRESMKRR